MFRRHLILITMTALIIATCCLLLAGCLLPTADTTPAVTTTAAASTPTPTPSLAPTSTPTPSPSPTPSPAPTPIPQLLPADPITESYFGPLPVPSAVLPLEHHEARALYIGAGGNLESNLAVARETEVNSLVIDLKESDGIYFDCEVPLALEIGAVKHYYDLAAIAEKCHAEGVILIGRIVCFKDAPLAAARPEYCIRDADGSVLRFPNEGGKSFISPYCQEAWQYNIDIALDAIAKGVDEIQFDYVRFPTGAAKGSGKPWFGPEAEVPDRIQAINRFLQTAAIRISYEKGIPLGADVFSIIVTNTSDSVSLGQEWATAGLTGIDSISPMIYPSHYANSSTGHYTGNGQGTYINGVIYPKPDLEPYNIIYNCLLVGRDSTRQDGYAACRPYLQAFTASYLPEGYYQTYGSEQIRQQIKAVEDAGFSEWILWDPAATYASSAFDPEP